MVNLYPGLAFQDQDRLDKVIFYPRFNWTSVFQVLKLVMLAQDLNVINGLKIGSEELEVSHLQFADDNSFVDGWFIQVQGAGFLYLESLGGFLVSSIIWV